MQIFHLASRADIGLWTSSYRNANKSKLFSHVRRNVGFILRDEEKNMFFRYARRL